MSIAVVIVNYNSADLVQQVLEHLQCQTVLADEIIIVDNASPDLLERDKLNALQNVTLLRLDENVGYGAAINAAVTKLDGFGLLCCLNPDAFPAPDWIENLVQAAVTNPNHGSFASLMLRDSNTDIVDGAGDVLHFSGLPWRRHHGRIRSSLDLRDSDEFSACAGAAMYRLKALRQVGGFAEDYFMYLEDVDLGFRLQAEGFPCRFVAKAVVNHIGSATTGQGSDFSIYHGHRNVIWCYFRNMPAPLLLLFLPFHLLMNLLVIVKFALKGQGAAILRAKRDGILGIPDSLAKRNTISTHRLWQLLTFSLKPPAHG